MNEDLTEFPLSPSLDCGAAVVHEARHETVKKKKMMERKENREKRTEVTEVRVLYKTLFHF